MLNRIFFGSLLFSLALVARANSIKFNPESPIYIEYQTASTDMTTGEEVTLQIEDANSPSVIRLMLQPKPEAKGVYYGYLWLQLGKKITDSVVLRKPKGPDLEGWMTEQEGLQALFLFDTAAAMADFQKKAALSKKPLTDKSKLPSLVNPSGKPIARNLQVAYEADEAVKYDKLIAAYNALSPEQQKANDLKARQLTEAALKSYRAQNFKAAEMQFSQSLRLNPTLNLNKYYLGLCYYQLKNHERSLALLSLAEGAEYNYAEYKYYTGLNQMKLRRYDKSLESFADAKDEADADYSGPAAFFAGHIYFQKENYALARPEFEYTLDHSKDVKMDREAERMIEKIDQMESFKAQMKERFRYMLFAGLSYDSNVLNISTDNLTTNLAAYRVLYGATLGYKFFHSMSQDLSIDFGVSDTYSLNDKFKADTTVQTADPLQMGLSLPYHRRFQSGKRTYTWGLLPAYQTLTMNLDGSSRKKILDSTILGTDLTFAVSESFYSRYYAEYSNDKSNIPVPTATPEVDLSAKKITVSTTQTFLTKEKIRQMWLGDLGYVMNDADGNNNDYNKILAAVTYSQLGFWNATNTARLDFFNTKYTKIATSRSDNVLTATLGLSKDLTKKITLNLSGLYTLSESNVANYKYNKFAVQSMISYGGAF